MDRSSWQWAFGFDGWERGTQCVSPPVIPLPLPEDSEGEYAIIESHTEDRHRQTDISTPGFDFGRKRRRYKHD